MNEFRRLAAKIDQHMQQLAAQGVSEAHAIVNRMMGYVPDLHKIWVGTSDRQLMALSREYPGFYRYAHIMEDASQGVGIRERGFRPPGRAYQAACRVICKSGDGNFGGL